MPIRNALILCGTGDEAALAESWAEEQARAARMGHRAARAYARKIRHGYETACTAFLCSSGENPVMKISVEQDSALTPRFDMVDTASDTVRMTPRARRTLALRAAARTRAAAKAAAHSA